MINAIIPDCDFMNNVIRSCPKDETRHKVDDARACEICGGAMRYYCTFHQVWLTGSNCPKCGVSEEAPLQSPMTADPGSPVQGSGRGHSYATMALIGIATAVLMTLITVFGIFAYHFIQHQREDQKPIATNTSRDVPTPTVSPNPPQPREVIPLPAPPPKKMEEDASEFPAYPPIETSIAKITVNTDAYVGKWVQISGTMQLNDSAKRSFELTQGAHSIPVFYGRVTSAKQSAILGATEQRGATVVGFVKIDPTTNSCYMLARDVDLQR